MTVYFDNCAIQRPMDDRSNFRIRIEAEAMIALMELVENDELRMVSSVVLDFEINNTPDPERVEFGVNFTRLSKSNLKLTNEVINRAKVFENYGVKPIDALHLSLAVVNEIEYLCTCDDRFLRRANEIINIATKVILPTDLVKEILK
jgi:predicted nucleic acid-binding protein